MNERGGRKEEKAVGRKEGRKEGEMVFEKEQQQQPRAKSREKGIGEEVVGRAEYYKGSWEQ